MSTPVKTNVRREGDRDLANFIYPVPAPERPTFGREEEIAMLLDAPFQTRIRHRVLVGQAGCGKTQLVREVAGRLKDEYNFVELSVSGAVAGMKYVGDFEKRIRYFFAQMPPKTIVFIDEIHTIVGAGRAEGEKLDFGQILKPYLSDPNSNIVIWGATTPEEYRETIYRDAALRRRLPAVYLAPMKLETLRQVLYHMADETKLLPIATAHTIADQCLEVARFDTPDAPLDLLDRVLARVRRTGDVPDPSVLANQMRVVHEEIQNASPGL